MKITFISGIIASVVVANVTIAIKLATSKYPGIGDFWIYWAVSCVPSCSGASFIYIGKSLLAALVFAILFRFFRKTGEILRMALALATTILLLILLSLGQVVLA